MLARLAFVTAAAAYVVYPWLCRLGASRDERTAELPGDERIPHPAAGYTLAVDIAAPAEDVWPWLLQIGQGRGGFYTHELVETLLGTDIHNAERIEPTMQDLMVGDVIRLTPDPYLGRAGQTLVVSRIERARALVLERVLPNGGSGTWAFVLHDRADGTTRLLFRRRADRPSLVDRLALPGYLFMDRGMLAGIRRRAESKRRRALPAAE